MSIDEKSKISILLELNNLGVGYCSPEACREDIMGVGVSFDDILKVPFDLLLDMLIYYKYESR